MKTPKRTCRDCLFFTPYCYADPDGRCGEGCGTYGTHTRGTDSACDAFMLSSAARSARRKRKNRITQLKRTIARLTDELAEVKKANSYLYSAYLAHTLDDLIGIQSTCLARTAENAKQITLACTDAEQSTERKEKE